MNELIQKLAEQHFVRIEFERGGVHECYEFSMEELEHFAKLIVKECAGIYDKIDNGNLHMGTYDYLEALNKTFFGIEE